MIRVATIGTSVITSAFAAAAERTAGIRIDVVTSRSAERAAASAAELGVAGSAHDLTELYASDRIDAVYIASPNSAHRRQALEAIRAGKHVIVEKPAVTTAADWRELVAEAAAHGVVVLEAIRNEYDRGMAAVREALPELGAIRRVSLRSEQRSSRYDKVLAGEHVNMFDPAMAGGALFDLGIYCVHPLVALFGEPSSVAARQVPVRSGVDGAGHALLGYDGFVADVSYSKITSSRLPSEIQGEVATLEIDHIASPRRLVLRGHDGAESVRELDAPQHVLDDEVARFVELIETRADASLDHARTEATLRVMEAMRADW